MSKKREIQAIERRLADLLTGATGRLPSEAWRLDDEGRDAEHGGVMAEIGLDEFGRWICAVASGFGLNDTNKTGWLIAPHNLGKFDYIETAAAFLWENGVRA